MNDMKYSVILIPWYSMSRARYETEQLRAREDEVEDLWQEKQQQCLGEMGLNTDHRKRHSCDIAEGVTRESPCRIPGTEGHVISWDLDK
jgi:hypothetical protein